MKDSKHKKSKKESKEKKEQEQTPSGELLVDINSENHIDSEREETSTTTRELPNIPKKQGEAFDTMILWKLLDFKSTNNIPTLPKIGIPLKEYLHYHE
eukprot:Pgem_evm1s12099